MRNCGSSATASSPERPRARAYPAAEAFGRSSPGLLMSESKITSLPSASVSRRRCEEAPVDRVGRDFGCARGLAGLLGQRREVEGPPRGLRACSVDGRRSDLALYVRVAGGLRAEYRGAREAGLAHAVPSAVLLLPGKGAAERYCRVSIKAKAPDGNPGTSRRLACLPRSAVVVSTTSAQHRFRLACRGPCPGREAGRVALARLLSDSLRRGSVGFFYRAGPSLLSRNST